MNCQLEGMWKETVVSYLKILCRLCQDELRKPTKIHSHDTRYPGRDSNLFLIGIVGGWGGVQLGPLGTAAINRLIVPAPGDYDDGEIGGMIGRGNRSTRRNLPQCRFVHHKPHMLPGRESGPPWWEDSV
jgi:hypothetical protein